MNVIELINKLRHMPQDADVVLDTYDGGLEEIAKVTLSYTEGELKDLIGSPFVIIQTTE